MQHTTLFCFVRSAHGVRISSAPRLLCVASRLSKRPSLSFHSSTAQSSPPEHLHARERIRSVFTPSQKPGRTPSCELSLPPKKPAF
eukprot:416361-Pleurochrysis_carterae.AAC.1